MYKSKKRKTSKVNVALNVIDENRTIKIPKRDEIDNRENQTSANCDKELFSQETIPASQEPTQRYLSQRSNLLRTQSRSTQRAPTTYFELVLIKAGVDFDDPDNFVISRDNISFVNEFEKILSKSHNYPSNVETFQVGLRDALNDKKLAMKLLSGCTIIVEGNENPYQSQQSMLANFLMVEFLQKIVINTVLDKLEECSVTEQSTSNEIPIIPLMLSQLQYVAQSHGDLIYSRIVDIFEKAVPRIKWDIIAHAEIILKSSKHDAFADMILNSFANSKDVFNSTAIQTFTNLCLSIKMQVKLRRKAMGYIKEDCPAKVLPLLVKVFLKLLNDADETVICDLLNDLREDIIWTKSNRNESEIKRVQTDVFNCLTQGLTRSKKFFDCWQRVIQNLTPANFRSIDFLILLNMMSIKEERSTYIQNLICRRVKQEHCSSDIFSDMTANYGALLELLTNDLVQLLYDFLKDKNKIVSNFAKNGFNSIFAVSESTQKNILLKLVDVSCNKTSLTMTTTALELIKTLRKNYPSGVMNWGMILMPLLDRLNEMILPQTRLVMELLCSIAYPPLPLAECPLLQNQIEILVKKQIISRNPTTKKQGIIGAVQIIDNIARIQTDAVDNICDANASFNSIEDLPDGRAKTAATSVVRIQTSTLYCPESLALFYDELATVCSAKYRGSEKSTRLDKNFATWLCELVTDYFQTRFIVEDLPENNIGIPVLYQKCINTQEDNDSTNHSELIPISVNISQLVFNPPSEASSSILVLAPLFNLMYVLNFIRYEGSLEMINALLGCGLILPSVFDRTDNIDIFYEYDESQCKKILDIFFHTVNWMRGTISAFSSQNDKMIREKVLIRLTELIQIEARIRKLLSKCPYDYSPPICQFMTIPKATGATTQTKKPAGARSQKKDSKKSSSKKKNNTTTEPMETEDSRANTSQANTTKITHFKLDKIELGKFETAYGPKEVYRQISPDIMLILKEEFDVKYPRSVDDIKKSIGLLEFKFIMNDIVIKVESITGAQKFIYEQQYQHIVYPDYFINDIINQFLEKIMANFEQISSAISVTLQSVDGALGNSDLFTDEMNYLKVCFSLCLRLLAALFSWSNFGSASSRKQLKEAFLVILGKSRRKQFSNQHIPTLAEEVFKKCLSFESSVVDIKSAVQLYHLLNSLRKFTTKQELDSDIRNTCKIFLYRRWFNCDGTMDRGSLCNLYLDELVKGYLRKSDFRRQINILTVLLGETRHLTSKESCLKSFPNFKKANFPMLFRGLCETFINSVTDAVHTGGTAHSDLLMIWEKSCEILNTLLKIVQTLDLPRNFILFLKHANLYLKIVLQHGLPVYEQYLRQSPERVNDLLKNLQVTTRFLHNLCCHSKAIQNTAIVNQVPMLRETLELLVYRVKAMLAANKCASAFWMGNLKNKDLHGDEILSQTASLRSAEEVNSDEDIPDDDISVDETIVSENSTGGIQTNPEGDSSRSVCF